MMEFNHGGGQVAEIVGRGLQDQRVLFATFGFEPRIEFVAHPLGGLG